MRSRRPHRCSHLRGDLVGARGPVEFDRQRALTGRCPAEWEWVIPESGLRWYEVGGRDSSCRVIASVRVSRTTSQCPDLLGQGLSSFLHDFRAPTGALWPVLVATPWRDVDHVVRMANDSHYGVAAYVWGRDLDRTLGTAHRLEAGLSAVNQSSQPSRSAHAADPNDLSPGAAAETAPTMAEWHRRRTSTPYTCHCRRIVHPGLRPGCGSSAGPS